MIGIQFKINNEYSSLFTSLLKNINLNEHKILITELESYNIHLSDGEIDGINFKKIINQYNEYYILFGVFKFFPKEDKIINIDNYNDFINSKCRMIILIHDAVNIEIYFNNENLKDKILNNLKTNYQIKTLDNDKRIKMSVQ